MPLDDLCGAYHHVDFPLAELLHWMVVRFVAGMTGAGSGGKLAEVDCSWIGLSSTSTVGPSNGLTSTVPGWPLLHEGAGVAGCVGAVVGGRVVESL